MAKHKRLDGAMKPGKSGGAPIRPVPQSPEAPRSETRSVRWKVMLAHDAGNSTCDELVDAIVGALGNVDVSDVSSVQAGVAAIESPIDVCLVCLDLPPAPMGGARLAEELMMSSIPVVLVTRSQRWIPPQAVALRELPWVRPDASATEVSEAIAEAMATQGRSGTWPIDEHADAAKLAGGSVA